MEYGGVAVPWGSRSRNIITIIINTTKDRMEAATPEPTSSDTVTGRVTHVLVE